ncbi:integrase catalytic core [Colletotrichum tofieldiae]|uniref:Integrase catalytic core n=1 Tax=Colletotrichum tofieldiae TaxID=708197 RepID=A0A166U9H0_9PEZI|nr:integrase catalytic core [Colletotrichum tofieldiae]
MLSWLVDADTPCKALRYLKNRYQQTPKAEKMLTYRTYRDHLTRLKRLSYKEISVTHQQATLLNILKGIYPDFTAPLAAVTTREATDNISLDNRLSNI